MTIIHLTRANPPCPNVVVGCRNTVTFGQSDVQCLSVVSAGQSRRNRVRRDRTTWSSGTGTRGKHIDSVFADRHQQCLYAQTVTAVRTHSSVNVTHVVRAHVSGRGDCGGAGKENFRDLNFKTRGNRKRLPAAVFAHRLFNESPRALLRASNGLARTYYCTTS